jgi:hypothetical protein
MMICVLYSLISFTFSTLSTQYANIASWHRFYKLNVGTIGADFLILVMMQLFEYANGIEGWSSSISVTIVILDDVPYYKLINPAAFGKGMGIVSPESQGNSDVAYFYTCLTANGWIFDQTGTGMLEVNCQTKNKLWESPGAAWLMRHSLVTIADPRSDIPLLRDATLMKSSDIVKIDWRATVEKGLVSTNANTSKLVIVYDVKQVDTKGQVVKDLGTKNRVGGKNNSVCKAFSGKMEKKVKACKTAREQLDASRPDKASLPVECVVRGGRYTIVARYKLE